MKSKTTHKKKVYNKHINNTYKVIHSKTKKDNNIKNKSNKTRKVKKHYNSQQLELHNGGGFFSAIYNFRLNKRIKNFINKTKFVDTLYNSLIKYIKFDKHKVNISILKDSIYNFIFNVLKKLYYLLKSNKSLFIDNYKQYYHKKLFKYDNENNKFNNDIIISVLTKFINKLLSTNVGLSIYPLKYVSYSYSYGPSTNFESIGNYFDNNNINKSNIILYISKIIDYDNTIINNISSSSYSSSTYLLPNNNNNPKIKYDELLYIKQKQTSLNSKKFEYNTIFLIIYKNFNSTQLKNKFIYGLDLIHDDFYVLENTFLNLLNELRNINTDTTHKNFKKLLNKYDDIIFNSKNANLYGEFLFYYYKSFVFSNQR
jgi:hypothetical protein